MKTLALLSLSLTVALGLPLGKDVAQVPVFNEGDQSPLQGEWLPAQGHVVAQDPVPQVRLGSKEQQEPEVKVKPEAKVEPELKAEPEVKPEPVVQVEPEVKPEPVVQVEPEVKAKQEVKEEPEVKPEPVVQVEPEVKTEPEAKMEPEVKEEPEGKTEAEVKVGQELIVEPEILAEQEVHMGPELKDDIEPKVESELEFKEDTEPELIPLFDEEQEFQKVQEDFPVQMNLEPEPEASHWEFDGRPEDMVRNYEMMSDPIMELEPLDDDNMFREEVSDAELLEMERSVQATFQNQDPEVQPVPEDEGLVRERTYNLDPEPIMELEPLDDDNMFGEEVSDAGMLEMERSVEATFQNQDPEVQLVPEDERPIKERTYNLDPEPIMELEPMMNN